MQRYRMIVDALSMLITKEIFSVDFNLNLRTDPFFLKVVFNLNVRSSTICDVFQLDSPIGSDPT